jgi:hypothetical protein
VHENKCSKVKALQCLMSKGPVVQSCNVDGRAGRVQSSCKGESGYDRKGPKLLGSFKAILFQKHLKRVLLCPVRLQFLRIG